MQRCWNWFLERNQSRDGGEPAEIIALVDNIIARHPIDPQRVFVAGLSAGGAMAAILAEQAPDRFAAVGIMAGVPLHASRDVAGAYAAMRGDIAPAAVKALQRNSLPTRDFARLRVTAWTGTVDRTVAPANAATVAHQFLSLLEIDPAAVTVEHSGDAEITRWRDAGGQVRVEVWRVAQMGHAWSGGSFRGSHTHPKGPRASDEMMAFFLNESSVAQVVAEPEKPHGPSNAYL